MSAGLLKPTADTQLVIEAPNIIGSDVTVITSKGIGNTVGRTVIDIAHVNSINPATGKKYGLTTDERVAFAGADRPDMTYVGGNIISGQFNFNRGTSSDSITRLDGGDWASDGFVVGMSIQVGGSTSANATAKAVFYQIAGISGNTITLTGGTRLVASEAGMVATLTPVILDPTAPGHASVKYIAIDQRDDVNIEVTGKLNVQAGNDIYIGTVGSFSVDHVTANGTVRIKAKGDISNVATTGYNVSSSDLILEAGLGGIGTSTKSIQVNLTPSGALAGTLTARAFYDLYISSPGDLRLEGVSSQTSNVYLTAGGSILDGLHSDSAKIAANVITLNAGGTIGTSTDFLETDMTAGGKLRATASGSIYLHEVLGDMNVDGIKSLHGDVALWAHQSILDMSTSDTVAGKPAIDVFGNNITLISDFGRIGISGNDLDIDSAFSGSGMLTTSSYLGANIIEVAGDLTINQIKAGLGLGNDNIAFIKAPVGNIINGRSGGSSGAGNSNVKSGRAYLFARDNIGAPGAEFYTETGNIEGEATLGSAYIINTGAMTIGGVTTSTTGMVANGTVNITTMSPMTVDKSITVTSNEDSNGNIVLNAHDKEGDGDFVLVKAGVVLTARNKIKISAGDRITIENGAILNAGSDIELDGKYNNDDNGTVIEVYGTLTGSSVSITGGDLGDTIVLTNVTSPTLIDGGAGNDNIYIGSNATPTGNTGGTVNCVNAQLTLIGGAGTADTVIIDDTANAASKTVEFTDDGAGKFYISGLSPATIYYDSIDDLNINLANKGNTVNFRSVQGASAIDLKTGTGADAIYMGNTDSDSTSTLNELAGHVTVDGQGGIDSLRLNDSGDSAGNAGTMTATTITGLGTAGITYSNLETVTIDLGSGADSFTVNGTNATTTTNINGHAGDDAFTVGTLLSDMKGQLNLTAGAGTADGLIIDNKSANIGQSGTLTETTLSGFGLGSGINYQEFENFGLVLGTGDDVLYVASTMVGANSINLNDGNDVINIDTVGGSVTPVKNGSLVVFGGAGNDTFRVNYDGSGKQTFLNGIHGELTLHGEAGGDLYEIGLSGGGSSIINVADTSPAGDLGINTLRIYGTKLADYFLFRPNAISSIELDADRQPKTGGGIERINYDGSLNGGISIFGRDGDDTFVFDDTTAPLTVYGDAGKREVLIAAGLMRAKVLVITYKDKHSALSILRRMEFCSTMCP